MDKVLTGGQAPAGRLGHGLGMQLTEGPSIIPADQTVLAPGVVLTLEPAIDTHVGTASGNSCLLVHEENVVITETGPRWLTRPQQVPLPRQPIQL